MSKKDKLLEKLRKKPHSRDFTWEELITLARRAGFTESCSGGSHYVFEHESGFRFRVSKTHPSGVLKKYQLDAVMEALSIVNYH